MKVSVIVPVYNAEQYLTKCLESIINQTFKHLEIILVNDGSKDSSGKICELFKNKDSRIFVIHQINQGASAARNKGLDIASGEWIINVDADDWLEPDMIEQLYQSAITNDAEIVACGAIKETSNESIRLLYRYGPLEEDYNRSTISILNCAFWNKLIKRDLYERSKARSTEGITMWDDHLVTSILRFHSKKTFILPVPLYHYRWMGQPSISTHYIGRFPDSEIKVAKLIDNYFQTYINEGNRIAKAIVINSKFSSKLPILTPNIYSKDKWITHNGKNGIKLWQSIFPELRYVPDLFTFIPSKKNKLKAWIAFTLPTWITSRLFYITIWLSKVIKQKK